jgi:hypothetical protein
MSENKITYSVHDYTPVNKYIDEKSRIQNTKSVWGYTKSIALFLLALGLFLILAAYAYHLYKNNYYNDLVEEGKEINKTVEGEQVVYSQTVNRFDESPTIGRFRVITGYKWDTVNDLRFGKPHVSTWCYLELISNGTKYSFDRDFDQSGQLNLMNISESEAQSYQNYCSNK